ncbi:MAG: hypothetical protein JNL85_02150 [Rubrivivax sp.]|nr:hypothetical protein [Rubrivivax sp.]
MAPSARRRCLAVALPVALAAFTPFRAEAQAPLAQAEAVAKTAAEINAQLAAFTGPQARLLLKELKEVTGAAGALAPYLGALNLVAGFVASERSPEQVMLDEFRKTNEKIDGLYGAIAASTAQITVATEVALDDGVLKQHDALLRGVRDAIRNAALPLPPGSLAGMYGTRQLQEVAQQSQTACQGLSVASSLFDNVAKRYHGNLDKIAAYGVLLVGNIASAKDLHRRLYTIRQASDPSDRRTMQQIALAADGELRVYDGPMKACSDAYGAAMRKYSGAQQRIESLRGFLAGALKNQANASDLLRVIDRQYPYLDWFVLRYSGEVSGFDKHYMRGDNSRMTWYLREAHAGGGKSSFIVVYAERTRDGKKLYPTDAWTQPTFPAVVNGVSVPSICGSMVQLVADGSEGMDRGVATAIPVKREPDVQGYPGLGMYAKFFGAIHCPLDQLAGFWIAERANAVVNPHWGPLNGYLRGGTSEPEVAFTGKAKDSLVYLPGKLYFVLSVPRPL